MKYSLLVILLLITVIPLTAQEEDPQRSTFDLTEDADGGLWFSVPFTNYQFDYANIEESIQNNPLLGSLVLLFTLLIVVGIFFLYYKTLFAKKKKTKTDMFFLNHVFVGVAILFAVWLFLVYRVTGEVIPS